MTLLGDTNRPGGVTFAFTERTGGVSQGAYTSLNLGSRCGDDAQAVAQNRLRALEALGAQSFAHNLIEPVQVHGDTVVVVSDSNPTSLEEARAQARAGADAIVCTVPEVPVLLCFADCVPVVLVTKGAFAVVHSGWRGTLARISAKTVKVLCRITGASPDEIIAYVGPHIHGSDYEVSPELLALFVEEFGTIVDAGEQTPHLDLSGAISTALEQAGLPAHQIVDTCCSTATNTDRFYSYRAEHGQCGRHAALAFMSS